MAQADFGTGKTLAVLAIVLGCFAILWPKIFYPMWQAAFALSNSKVDSDGRYRETDRPPHLHPGSVNPRMRGGISPENVQDKFMMREGRPFPHPQARQPTKSQPKSGGAMSIIMPIYTVGIIVFFLYTVLKLVFKKNPEEQKKPLIKDFHMDPEYRKFVCQQTNDSVKPLKSNKRSSKNKSNLCDTTIHESANENKAEELDAKDYEIYKLKKRLEETEQAMERIIQHIGVVSAVMNKPEKKIVQKSDVRNRRKNESKKKSEIGNETLVEAHGEEEEYIEELNLLKNEEPLENYLKKLHKMCTTKEESIKSFDTSSDPIEEDVEGSDYDEDSTEHESDEQKDSVLEDMITSERKKMPCE